jgi:hypothetical protein
VQHGTRAAQIVTEADIAYIAAGETGLKIYNVADPAHPVLLGGCATAGAARDLALAGDTLYVADDSYGLTAVDISDPAAPSVVSTSLNTSLAAVRVLAGEAGVLAASDGHRIQMFSGLAPAGSCDVDGHVFDLAFHGNLLLVAAGDAGLLVVDASNRASPTLIGSCDTPGAAVAVTVSAGEVYLVDDETGALRVDLSNPQAPVLAETLSSGRGLRDVALAGATAITAGNALVHSTELAPVVPVDRETFSGLVRAMQVAVSGSSILVAEADAGVAILRLAVAGDRDGDQMPDSWEQQIVDADPDDEIESIDDVMPQSDFDGDGLSNAPEFIAGTDPTDADSRFAQIAPALPTAGTFTVQWYSVTGKRYTVYKSTNLADGFTPVATDILGTSPVNAYRDDSAGGASAFYMVTVQQ